MWLFAIPVLWDPSLVTNTQTTKSQLPHRNDTLTALISTPAGVWRKIATVGLSPGLPLQHAHTDSDWRP